MSDAISWAGIGAGIGTAFAPGVGTLIGAGVGLVAGGVSDAFAADNKASADLLGAQADYTNARTSYLQTGVQINQAKSDISAYDSFLKAFPNYADLQKNTFEAQSRGEFRSLLNNYAMVNVAGGASGRTGGSIGLIAKENQDELIDFTGADMELGGRDGGRYQMAGDELRNNLTMQEKQAMNQRDILRSSLDTLKETQGLYNTAMGSANARVTSETKAKETWWNPFD